MKRTVHVERMAIAIQRHRCLVSDNQPAAAIKSDVSPASQQTSCFHYGAANQDRYLARDPIILYSAASRCQVSMAAVNENSPLLQGRSGAAQARARPRCAARCS